MYVSREPHPTRWLCAGFGRNASFVMVRGKICTKGYLQSDALGSLSRVLALIHNNCVSSNLVNFFRK